MANPKTITMNTDDLRVFLYDYATDYFKINKKFYYVFSEKNIKDCIKDLKEVSDKINN